MILYIVMFIVVEGRERMIISSLKHIFCLFEQLTFRLLSKYF